MNKKLAPVFVVVVMILIYVFQIRLNDGNYKVVSVADGDTITVSIDGQEESIRLIGVDTPETHHPSKPEQCYGPEASGFTTGKLLGQTVRLEADPLSGNRDRYDRLLRFVYFDNKDFNQQLISEGYGFAVTGFDHTKLGQYVSEQDKAESNGAGLWSDCTIDDTGDYLMTTPNTF